MKRNLLAKILIPASTIIFFVVLFSHTPIIIHAQTTTNADPIEYKPNTGKKLGECEILSMEFSPKYGQQGDDFYKNAEVAPEIYATIIGDDDCKGKGAEVSITSGTDIKSINDVSNTFTNKSKEPATISFHFTAGESGCGEASGPSNDCSYHIEISNIDGDDECYGNCSSIEDRFGGTNGKGIIRYDIKGTGQETGAQTMVEGTAGLDLGCSLVDGWDGIRGCIAALLYLIWEICAMILSLAGGFLDFFLYYSLNSSAYSSSFIETGWGVIRDVANIFFIITLLYIAIKTILNLNVSNNKRLIGAVMIIALIINFSLFITKVVIDSSNILAKVFYNQIQVKGEEATAQTSGEAGEKSISTALVSGFDPQSIVGNQQIYNKIGAAFFMLITLVMIVLTLYCSYMFFVIAILFVARVVSLWVAMIFSPLAFITYAVPIKKLPFQHDEWWKDLLGNAFMAPIFIFFLYIIVLFIDLGKEAVKINYINSPLMEAGTNITFNQKITLLMGAIIPFAIIFVMLTKAKKLAVDYSGEVGQMLSKAGGMATSFVGGGVVGFAAGALAKGGRATVGRAGSALANSQWATKMASSKFAIPKFLGNKAIDAGKAVSTKSFDIRGASVMGKTLASTGLKVGKAKQGGFEAAKAEQKAKRDARAAHLKEVSSKPEKAKQHKSEMDRADLANKMKADLDPLEKTIDKLKETLSIQSQGLGKDHPETQKTYLQLQNARDKKTAMLEGRQYEGDKTGRQIGTGEFKGTGKFESVGEVKDKDGNIIKHGTTREIKEEVMEDERVKRTEKEIEAEDYSKYNAGTTTDKDGKVHKRTIKYLDTVEIKDNAKAVFDKEAATLKGYARGMDSKLSKTFNFIFSGGEHSGKGAEETKMNIEKMARRLEESSKAM